MIQENFHVLEYGTTIILTIQQLLFVSREILLPFTNNATIKIISEIVTVYIYLPGYLLVYFQLQDALSKAQQLSNDYDCSSFSHITKIARLKKGKKVCKRVLPFYNRRKYLHSANVYYTPRYDKYGFQYLTPEEINQRDWKDVKPRLLHQCNFGNYFTYLCNKIPNFIQLFTHGDVICSPHHLSNHSSSCSDHCIFYAKDKCGVMKAFDASELGSNNNQPSEPLFQFQSSYLSGLDANVIFDSGASISASPYASDFISWTTLTDTPRLRGVLDEPVVQGVGTVELKLCCDD